MSDLIDRNAAIDEISRFAEYLDDDMIMRIQMGLNELKRFKSAQSEPIRCKDCKYWDRQTAYNGALLSFGFCECDDMWCSLYGETTEVAHIDTDDDFFCGFAERREDEND